MVNSILLWFLRAFFAPSLVDGELLYMTLRTHNVITPDGFGY